MNYSKKQLISKLSKCHDELKKHPFRVGFEKEHIGDYKNLLYNLTEIWCDLIYRCEEISENEQNRLRQFGYWIHDYRQYLCTWRNTTFPMHFFDYYEQMLQVTHNYIDHEDLSVFYNLDCYFNKDGKIIKSTKYIWVTKEDCGIDSEILPRYLPIQATLITDEHKIKELLSTGFYLRDSDEQKEQRFQFWLKNTKPVLEWLNKQRKTIDMEMPIWQSKIVAPSKRNN